ncbi:MULTISPECIES: hypothetical protein [unclassified Synechococcus]|uniref:hypothetical protein n=1 Tax=unclassified Synechococcus TaxID=2626047 RepID=UPI001623A597|nr:MULTISPECIES: hypothetical protein [unclassified Synechococcus]
MPPRPLAPGWSRRWASLPEQGPQARLLLGIGHQASQLLQRHLSRFVGPAHHRAAARH